MLTSEYSGFYKISPEQRLREAGEFASMSEEELRVFQNPDALGLPMADHMIENVIGTFTLPVGVALNFIVNGKDYLIPMVTEESSIVAAASNAAKMARSSGGFFASNTGSVMIAQVQLIGVVDPEYTRMVIYANKGTILGMCNEKDPVLVKLGGGARDIEVRTVCSAEGPMVIIHLKVDTRDAMGANSVNTMAEYVAPYIERITGGKVCLRILSNLAVDRLARSRVVISKEAIGGEEVVDGVITAYHFAEADPFRATTHNKGIMNGISAVVLATGNDTRAIESGAHAYACLSGRYRPMTTWEKNKNGDLCGTIEIPMAVGLVGGATKLHPTARAVLKLMGVTSAPELAEVIASVGLAQNLAAIRALATEGIQRGHMSLHASNVAIVAGATGDMLDKVVKQMIADKNINAEYAKELIKKFGAS